MPIDPSIPLAVNPPPDFLTEQRGLNSLREMQLRVRQQEQAAQAQNALKQILSNPANIDQYGNPTPRALGQITAVDPDTGLQFRQNQLRSEQTRLAIAGKKSELQQQLSSMSEDMIRSPSLIAYEEAKRAGQSEQAAQAAAQRAYSDGLQQLRSSGLVSDDQLALVPSDFNYARVKSRSMDYKTYLAQQEKEKRDKLDERKTAATERRADALEAAALNRGEQGWTLKTDPTKKDASGNPIQYRYNTRTAEATTLDGQPYTPGGAANISSGGQPRSGPAMVMQRYFQEHPNATFEEASRALAGFSTEQRATSAFGTGKQGDTVRSMNVAVQHLDTLGELATALGNNDVKAINRISNRFQDEFGSTAPSNFDAAKIVVGNEVIKAVIGAAGALGDRETAQASLDRAKTPEQLQGVIDTYQKLMAGQLNGLRRQYEQSTGQKDFDRLLDDRTKQAMRKHGYQGGGGSPSSGFIEGQIYRDANGNKARWENGEFVEVK